MTGSKMATTSLKTVSLLLIGIVALSIVPATVAIPGVAGETNDTTGEGRVLAAKIMIDRVQILINRINSLSAEYNISLNENQTKKLMLAEELLTNASIMVEDNPGEAIKLALRASNIVMPIAIHVIKALPPEAKHELMVKRTESSIEARMRRVENLKKQISWLEERSFKIPPEIEWSLNNASEYLKQAKTMIEAGENLSEVHYLIKNADREVQRAAHVIRIQLCHTWRLTLIGEASLKHLIVSVSKLTRLTNLTIEMIQNNDTEKAESMLTVSVNMLQRLIVRLNDLESKVNTSDTNASRIIELSKEIAMVLNTSATEALISLQAGDSSTAVSILEEGLNQTAELLEDLSMYAKWAFMKIKEIQGAIWKVRERTHKAFQELQKKMVAGTAASLMMTQAAYRKMKNLHDDGLIKCEAYKNILSHMLRGLQKIEEKSDKLPANLANMLNELTGNITSELNQLNCGK